MRAQQARIDARLPGMINLIDQAECGCSRWSVVTSFSDRQPPLYFLHDQETDALDLIGRSQPRIDARRMASRELQRFAARDGLGIPVYLTRPAGQGPWPAVVLVHGGPFLRGSTLAWQGEAQFLASRGYLVIEPEFRGSTGYGARLQRAGWKQWGLKMQDDIADAARWAIGQRLADPARICISGGSYGGYATLMGLIRDADLFRCGVALAAVTDIGLVYTLDDELSDLWREHGMPLLIGDRQSDAEQLAATSPLKLAAQLKRPLLMAHGGKDRRVPV
jgi:dipeptidyl aminopeptidase/acylaminoacyl peptidase